MNRSKQLEAFLESINKDILLFEDVDFSDINATNCEGENALHIAVHQENLEIAKELVSSGINVNARGDLGHTPLHEAAHNGKIETVKFLVENGADLYALTEGNPPFALARFGGHDEICDYLAVQMKKAKNKDDKVWVKAQISYLEREIDRLKKQLK